MTRAYNIVLLQPRGYVHSLCFGEIGRLLLHSFRSLGIRCRLQVNTFDVQAVNVVLGYNLISDPSVMPRCDYIVYQLEQLADREGWFRPAYLEIFRRAREVWDYSRENSDFLRAKGIGNVRVLPIGFHEELQTIRQETPDIDVLFYGSINPRRKAVLDDLARDVVVKTLFGVYGEARDRWIARSKIVLNVHFYDMQIMEQPRISYLLNNRRFVVSEESEVNPYEKGLVVAPYGQLADACRAWLDRPADRDRVAQAGFALFQSRPMTEYLRRVLQPIAGPCVRRSDVR